MDDKEILQKLFNAIEMCGWFIARKEKTIHIIKSELDYCLMIRFPQTPKEIFDDIDDFCNNFSEDGYVEARVRLIHKGLKSYYDVANKARDIYTALTDLQMAIQDVF